MASQHVMKHKTRMNGNNLHLHGYNQVDLYSFFPKYLLISFIYHLSKQTENAMFNYKLG